MATRYVRSLPVHLLVAKPPLSLKPSDAPDSQLNLWTQQFIWLKRHFQIDFLISSLNYELLNAFFTDVLIGFKMLFL